MLSDPKDSNTNLVIAIPVTGGRLCTHFGHCEWFALFEVDTANKQVLSSRHLDPPIYQPGLLPRWLHNQGVNVVIAGGLGQKARSILGEHGIEVHVGAPVERPEGIIRDYLDGRLRLDDNVCDRC